MDCRKPSSSEVTSIASCHLTVSGGTRKEINNYLTNNTMKKFLLYVFAASALLAAGACQKETVAPAPEGEVEAAVNFSIVLPDGLNTKAMSQAESTDIVYFEIWNKDWSRKLFPTKEEDNATAEVKNKKAELNLKLISDQTYNFIFWAQDKDCKAYDVSDLKHVKVKYDVIGANGNQDCFDAFYATKPIKVDGPVKETIWLTRPFAQLNFGADQMTTTFGPFVVTDTEITVSKLASVFNTIKGCGEEYEEDVKFSAYGLATSEILKTNDKKYTWVVMNYMLMMDDASIVNVGASFDVEGMDFPVTHFIENVPLKKNFRTNIVGDLFTTDATLKIVVDERFLTPDEVISVWDGTSMEEPSFEAATATYEIKNAAQLAWFAATVNGSQAGTQPKTFAGKTVKLVADIDLQNAPWTPIGYWETFEGTFDGDDHTIRNLNVTAKEADCYLGLFGCTKNAVIRNVNIRNASVVATVGDNSWAGGHLGVLIGYPDGTTLIENITLTGDIKVEGPMDKKGAQRIGAVVGGYKAASLTMKNIVVNASEASYVKGNLYVGGVAGQPICTATMTNVVSNIDVYSQDGMVGGIAGYVMPNSVLTDCSSTGNVYRVSAAGTEDQVKRLGGILGSWESSYGKVVLDGCAFEGALYLAGAEYADYVYGGLVGRAANTTDDAKGVLVINGLTFISEGLAVDAEGNMYAFNAAGLQEALDAAVEGTNTIFFGQNLAGDAIVKQVEGKNFVIDGKGYNYDGTIYIWGNARYEGAETLDIKNVNFKHAEGAIDFISSNTTVSEERYAHNVTIEGCTFEGGADAVAARFRQAFDITIKNSQVIAGHSLAQLYGCNGVTIDGATVKAGRGVSFGTSTGCVVNNSAFDVDSYGLRADGTAEGSLAVNSTSVKAQQPVIVRELTKKYAVALDAAVLEATDSYQVVFTNGKDDAAYVVPTGTYELTGAEGLSVYPVTDASSFGAAVANENLAVIDLYGKVTSVGLGFEVKHDVVLNMNGNEFNAGSTGSSTWYAIEASGEHNVVINDANFTRAGILAQDGADVIFNSGKINHKPERTSRYIFCAWGNGTTITIKNGTFKNDRAKNSFFWADGGAVIYVEGGNFGGVASNNKVVTSNGGKVIITGGTFNFDPTAWVAEGCTVSKSGSNWTVAQ